MTTDSAGWSFLAWGFLHGIALIIHRAWTKANLKMWGWLGWVFTFTFVTFAWVFFRAESITDALKITKKMISPSTLVLPERLAQKMAMLGEFNTEFSENWTSGVISIYTIMWIVLGFAITLLLRNSNEHLNNFSPNLLTLTLSSIAFIWGIFSIDGASEFLYFNF